MAAISSCGVEETKLVLDVALATPAVILPLRLARENLAHWRTKAVSKWLLDKIGNRQEENGVFAV